MNITPQFEKMEKKIFDVFQKMNWEEQALMVGELTVLSRQSYERAKSLEWENRTRQTASKIVQFPAATV